MSAANTPTKALFTRVQPVYVKDQQRLVNRKSAGGWRIWTPKLWRASCRKCKWEDTHPTHNGAHLVAKQHRLAKRHLLNHGATKAGAQ